MNTENSSNRSERFDRIKESLARLIVRSLPTDGIIEALPGLFFYRSSTIGFRTHAVIEPSYCVVAQGSKQVVLEEEVYKYNTASYLITTVGLPLVSDVTEASEERPYLGCSLTLDPAVVTEVMVKSGRVPDEESDDLKAIEVGPVNFDLLDATLRYVQLLDAPDDAEYLAPLILREIIFRLLAGEQGDRMRYIATLGGRAHRIAKALSRISQEFAQTLRIEDIAKDVHMSVSGFHAHFKAVTSMTPIQYQKHLRLQEARRLMLSENFDAAEAGYRVGYEDPSYFSRDYKRYFGEPPKRDIERLRDLSQGTR